MTAATISIRSTLEELGISSKPEALLVRDDAFFALVDDLLLAHGEFTPEWARPSPRRKAS